MRPHRLLALRHLWLAIHVRHGAAGGAGHARAGGAGWVARGCEVAPSEPSEVVSTHWPAQFWPWWTTSYVSHCLSITCAHKHRQLRAKMDLRDCNLEERSDLHVKNLRLAQCYGPYGVRLTRGLPNRFPRGEPPQIRPNRSLLNARVHN